jgi:hypothetical protein
MTHGNVGIMTAGKHSLGFCAGKIDAPAQHLGGIVALMYRPTGKNIEAAEKAHPLGATGQKHFKTAGVGRPNQRHSGCIARANHKWGVSSQ